MTWPKSSNYYCAITISLIFIHTSRNISLYTIFILEIRLHDISNMTNLLLFLFLSIPEKTSLATSSSISQSPIDTTAYSYLSIDLSRYIILSFASNLSSLLNLLRYSSIILFDFMEFWIPLSRIMILSLSHISGKFYPNPSILINDYLHLFILKSMIKSKEWIRLSNNIFASIAIINKIIDQIFFLSSNSLTIIFNIRSLIIPHSILITNIILNSTWISINSSIILFLQSKKWSNISKLYMKIFRN